MPALSPTMTQGNIGSWKKSIGDTIQPGDVLVEIETDKAQMEFECQEEGYLAQILLPEGTKEVAVGRPLAVLVERKEDVSKFKSFSLVDVEGNSKPIASKSAEKTDSKGSAGPERSEAPPKQDTPKTANPQPSTERIYASPLARTVAKEMGVELGDLAGRGSGPRGRIIKDDVIEMASGTTTSRTASTSYVDIQLSQMRKVIAERLSASKQEIPHYYLTIDVDVSRVNEVRTQLNQHNDGKFKLSMNDFIIKAAARAMSDVPEVNSTWHDTFIRQYQDADISVAVATPSGLITPIIHGANHKGLVDISEKVKELASLAKVNKLRPEQFQGGTFTISNLGMYGIRQFTAIINPPQTCILAVGGIETRMMPAPKDGTNSMMAKQIMSVTMSCDHRAVDGATGARWLSHFKRYLEDPISIIL